MDKAQTPVEARKRVRRILRELGTLFRTPALRQKLMNSIADTWADYILESAALTPHLFHTPDGWVETDVTDPQVQSGIPLECTPALWALLREMSVCFISDEKPATPVQPKTPADALIFHAILKGLLADAATVEALSKRVVSPLTELASFDVWPQGGLDAGFLDSDAIWALVEDHLVRAWLNIEFHKMREDDPVHMLDLARRQTAAFRAVRSKSSARPHRLIVFMRFYEGIYLFQEAGELDAAIDATLEALRKAWKRQRLADMQEEQTAFGDVFGVPFWDRDGFEPFHAVAERLAATPPYAQDPPTRAFLEEYARFQPIEELCRATYQRLTRRIS